MHKVWFFPVFEFHSRSETLRFKSSQSQLCFVHSSQFSTLEVSGGQIGFFFKYDWFCRRDGWQLFSSMQVWEQLVNQTKKASKDHAALADIYGTHISQRCHNITEDLQRMYKKVSNFKFTKYWTFLKCLIFVKMEGFLSNRNFCFDFNL